jgi:DNA-directed RNA polymerase subunit RPC12/RpoP
MYKCKKCEKPVLVLENHEPVRSCSCNTTIILDVEAVASGRSNVKN